MIGWLVGWAAASGTAYRVSDPEMSDTPVRVEVLTDASCKAARDSGCGFGANPATGTVRFSLRLVDQQGAAVRRWLAADDVVVTHDGAVQDQVVLDGRDLVPAAELLVVLVDARGPKPLRSVQDALLHARTQEAWFGGQARRAVVPLRFGRGVEAIDGGSPRIVASTDEWAGAVLRFRTTPTSRTDVAGAVRWATTDLWEDPSIRGFLTQTGATVSVLVVTGNRVGAEELEQLGAVVSDARRRRPGMTLHAAGVGTEALGLDAVAALGGGHAVQTVRPMQLVEAFARHRAEVPSWHRVEVRAPDPLWHRRPFTMGVRLRGTQSRTTFEVSPGRWVHAGSPARILAWLVPLLSGLVVLHAGLVAWARPRSGGNRVG